MGKYQKASSAITYLENEPNMRSIKQEFTVPFAYDVAFTEHLFDESNPLFADTVSSESSSQKPTVLFFLDSGMYECHPGLMETITT